MKCWRVNLRGRKRESERYATYMILQFQTMIMQYFKRSFRGLLFVMLFAGCEKTSINLTAIASLNLVNAVVNSTAIKANFTGLPKSGNAQYQFFSQIATVVNYGSNN